MYCTYISIAKALDICKKLLDAVHDTTTLCRDPDFININWLPHMVGHVILLLRCWYSLTAKGMGIWRNYAAKIKVTSRTFLIKKDGYKKLSPHMVWCCFNGDRTVSANLNFDFKLDFNCFIARLNISYHLFSVVDCLVYLRTGMTVICLLWVY